MAVDALTAQPIKAKLAPQDGRQATGEKAAPKKTSIIGYNRICQIDNGTIKTPLTISCLAFAIDR
jgi:hypothetical protein